MAGWILGMGKLEMIDSQGHAALDERGKSKFFNLARDQ